MKLAALILFISSSFAASDRVQVGLYSGAVEVHDTVAFELVKGGKAVITSDYFNLDGSKKKLPDRVMKGTWSYREPFLTISYGAYRDKFRKEDCPQPNPCYKFEESEGKKPSPLNAPYGFGLRSTE